MYSGENINFEKRTPNKERLCDFFAVFNCAGAPDSYFEESLDLLRPIETRHPEVIDRLELYLQPEGNVCAVKLDTKLKGAKPWKSRTWKNRRGQNRKNERTKSNGRKSVSSE
jgi:hypothetical protein